MIRDHRVMKVYEGNTCYCATEKHTMYDGITVEFSQDHAWEIIERLLADIRRGETTTSLHFYEDLGDAPPK